MNYPRWELEHAGSPRIWHHYVSESDEALCGASQIPGCPIICQTTPVEGTDTKMCPECLLQREDRAMDALIVAAMRGIDLPDLISREEVLEGLLRESLPWLKTYKCGEGDHLIPRIERALTVC
jgi:hypothetical protein